jgi:hypothetical protein
VDAVIGGMKAVCERFDSGNYMCGGGTPQQLRDLAALFGDSGIDVVGVFDGRGAEIPGTQTRVDVHPSTSMNGVPTTTIARPFRNSEKVLKFRYPIEQVPLPVRSPSQRPAPIPEPEPEVKRNPCGC